MSNKDEVMIRPMQKEDVAAVVNIVLKTSLWQRYGVEKESLSAALQQSLKTDDELIVAEKGRQICGFAWLLPKGFVARSPYIKMIGVMGDCTGLGIGKKLLNTVERGKTEIFLLTSDFNKNAQEFYRKNGYKQIGAIPNYILDNVDELIFYRKIPKD